MKNNKSIGKGNPLRGQVAHHLSSCVHSLLIGKEEVKTPIYVCVCVRARVCDYTTKKYTRKMCYHQKNNSNVKTFEKLKNIKES